MLQEAVDALFDNGRRSRAVRGQGDRPLKSLSDMLKGKQGRFRQNLLGKRVDYSGRSVIVVGPELKLHQCGLPKNMALELFKPFNIRKLAIGRYHSTPNLDICLVCSYLTKEKPCDKDEGRIFYGPEEVRAAYDHDAVGLHAKIRMYWDGRLLETTVGRVIFNEHVPAGLRFVNQEMDKKSLENLVGDCYRQLGPPVTAGLLDDLKDVGFQYSTQAGITVGIDDILVPENKPQIIAKAQSDVERIQKQYQQGVITEGERYNKVIDT